MSAPPKTELQIRSSRAVGFAALAIGALGLVLAVLWEPLRGPLPLAVFGVAILVGVWRVLDRRVRLEISPDGIRYADWGAALVPWEEFSGYTWTSWRQNLYLQLNPRRPSEMVASFSWVGRLNHFAAGWTRMPRFAIAITPLDLGEVDLDEAVARYLPRSEPMPG